MRCLLCHSPDPDMHHFPRTRKFSDATVPLCRACHTKAHMAHHPTIERLILLAPAYWKEQGEWDAHKDEFETWLSRRAYLEATCR